MSTGKAAVVGVIGPIPTPPTIYAPTTPPTGTVATDKLSSPSAASIAPRSDSMVIISCILMASLYFRGFSIQGLASPKKEFP
jgi:hypothetical protein